jgi:meso-butanediol dehydrogenase/(S,S)-butanediol dehydrogenase/diacetyl reductase
MGRMNKTIVITGAGDGLGRALARRFAADGDRIVLLGRTLSKVQAVAAELGEPSFAVECDVSVPASVRAAFAEIAGRCEHVDALINCAAAYEPFTLAEVTDEQVMSMVGINLAGPVLCSREALPLLRGGGRIINVTTESIGIRFAMQWLYTGTKAGLETISSMLDRELASDGIRVTSVRCGQMYDETKGGSSWPIDLVTRFAAANAKVGVDFRNRPLSHYNSVAETFHHIVNLPADTHVGHVEINGDRPVAPKEA